MHPNISIHQHYKDGSEDIVTLYRGFEIRQDVNGICTILKKGVDRLGMTWRSLEKAKQEVDELVDEVRMTDGAPSVSPGDKIRYVEFFRGEFRTGVVKSASGGSVTLDSGKKLIWVEASFGGYWKEA